MHLRFMILYKPIPLLFVPGVLVFLLGLLLTLVIMLQGNVEAVHLHSLIFGSMLTIIAFQAKSTGIYMKAYAAVHGLCEKAGFIKKILDYHSLEKELIIGTALLLIGIATAMKVVLTWIGIQTIFTAIFLSVLLQNEGD